ncbi:MAG TPA: hypothetical protein VH951_03955 [Dehalococcoidia bacterium]
MPQSLVFGFAPSSRPVWGRRFLAAFFTLAVLIHLTAVFVPAQPGESDLTFSVLAFAAAAFAAAAVTLRAHSSDEPRSRRKYQKHAVLSNQALVKEVKLLLDAAARQRCELGLMLISVEAPAHAWQDSARLANAATRIVRDIAARQQGDDGAAFMLRESGVAFAALGSRTIPRLEVVADVVQREARAEFARNAALAACTIAFGIAETNPVRGSADGVIRNASLALRRATALQTGRYVLTRTD